MDILLIREPDSSHLVGQFPEDVKKILKIPTDKPTACTVTVRRSRESNSKLWGLCTYFWHNLPDRYWYEDEFGDLCRSFGSVEALYDYLKLQVGFCHTVKIGDKISYIPKSTNFSSLKDEIKYKEDFQKPAIAHLAIMADSTVEQLWEKCMKWVEWKKGFWM